VKGNADIDYLGHLFKIERVSKWSLALIESRIWWRGGGDSDPCWPVL